MNKNSALKTKHVFSKDGEVFLRKSLKVAPDEWYPINFYWMPVLKLERELG